MDPDPDPALVLTPFYIDFKDAKTYFFFNFPAGTTSSVKKIKFFCKNYCVKMLFCRHYCSPLNTFRRKGTDPEPDPYL